jgi:steroid delta-isomerase-like uncharacterized protein
MKSFLAKREAAIRNRDVDALMDLYADDVVVDTPAGGGTAKGKQAVESIYRRWFEAFPDFKLEDEQYVIDGGEVAHFARAVGTNVGGFMGLPATGKRFHSNLAFFFTVENGRITRERRIYDFTGMLIEIGVLKAKPL